MPDDKKFKISADLILKILAYLIMVAYAILLIFGIFFFPPTSEFYLSLNLFSNYGSPILAVRLLSYFIFILSVSWILRFVLKHLGKLLNKGKAVVDITCSLIKYSAAIVLLFFVLQSFGVDTVSILAGIGILSLIVGLGAQPLISDIIAGLFIVFEKVFDVGDIIVVDGFRGTISEIGIRTTKIVDIGGNVKVINNSDIRSIVNMTEQLSLACVEIGIEYGESLERVEAILKENLSNIKNNVPDIKEGPVYQGVSELGNSSVIIRFVAKCDEGCKYQVERDLNRQFKLLFDKYNINIPFPQVVVNQPQDFKNATQKQIHEAKQFVEEQKELSKAIGDVESNDF